MPTATVQKQRDCPERLEEAAGWFHEKWGIPLEAYRESMQACVKGQTLVPQWYMVLDEQQHMVAGAGVIENDFHDRPDLHPNVCAVFVEAPYRLQGMARDLLDFVRTDMAHMGVKRLYLVTDHTSFYEKCGWSFLTMVHDRKGVPARMYVAETQEP